MLNAFVHWIESYGAWAPALFVALFLAASLLTIWRLESMSAGGLEGTVLGTLIMPYCSGMGNLIFAFVLGSRGGSGGAVMTNALVNNVTNMTLLIGLPALCWGMVLLPGTKRKRRSGRETQQQVNRLSLLLTLMAVLFFSGTVWALGADGKFDFSEGLVMIGFFLFWQCFHVFDVLKTNARRNRSLGWWLLVDLALLGAAAYAQYISIDWLVGWLAGIPTGFISARNLGWLSGWLMVLPNGVLAMYYAWRGNPEIVYTSQVGDGHISIPLCLGVFTLFHTLAVPPLFQLGMAILIGAAVLHLVLVAVWGRLPRWVGGLLVGAYGVFLYLGLFR